VQNFAWIDGRANRFWERYALEKKRIFVMLFNVVKHFGLSHPKVDFVIASRCLRRKRGTPCSRPKDRNLAHNL